MRLYLVFLLSVYVKLIFVSDAIALEVRVESVEPEGPPVFVHDTSVRNTLSLPLQLFNDSGANENVALWQFSLSVISEPDAIGSFQIVGYSAPATPFFNSPISPPDISAATSQITFQAADIPMPPELPGKNIAPDESGDLLTIELASTGHAKGRFLLVMNSFEPPLNGSFWFGTSPAPQFYSNVASSKDPGQIVVAEIQLIPEPTSLTILGIASLSCLSFSRKQARRTHLAF